ncbi:MAG: VWA domain-containing protein [Candidatus Obscuribacter sp.]|nr:VWA domain-containing protein [Candidatus Obscuribacter sp.]
MIDSKLRRQKGAAVTGLVLALFIFIMMIGFFTFDTCRLQMAQRELTATCDAAALAGTAMLTSQDISDDDASDTKLLAAQQNAAGYARNMFQAGNMLGQPLNNAMIVSPYSATKVVGNPGETRVMISLADPQNDYVGVPPVSPACRNGRAIMVYAGYTYAPVFMGLIGVQKVGLNASSGGGLPQVDAVLVFDYSGSMDDATSVTFVSRAWNPELTPNPGSASSGLREMQTAASPGVGVLNRGRIAYYEIPSASSGTDSNRLSNYVQHNYNANPNGLQLNVLPPMNLQLVDNGDSQATPKFKFDDILRVNTILYRSPPLTFSGPSFDAHFRADYGTPPGNCTLQPAFGSPGIGGYGQYWDSTTIIDTLNSLNTKAAYKPQAGPAIPGTPDFLQGPKPYPSYDPNNIGALNAGRYITDMVVNIASPGTFPYVQPLNGPNTFVGFSYTFPAEEPDATIRGQSYTFENLGVLVEAARGNLDPDPASTNRRFQQALLDRGSTLYLAPGYTATDSSMTTAHIKAGYQLAYQRLAMLFSQPIATAVDGADGGFFQKINTLTDCRFGLVGFSNREGAGGAAYTFNSLGTAHGVTDYNSYFVSPRYATAQVRHFERGYPTNSSAPNRGNGANPAENNTSLPSGTGFRTPRHVLNKNEAQATAVSAITGGRKASTISGGVSAAWSAFDNNAAADGLENGRPIDNTDCGEAMTTAYQMFINSGVYNVNVLTESRPAGKHAIVFFTDGVPSGGDGGSEATECRSRADDCRNKGIAIFTIGLDVTANPVLQSTQSVFLGNGSNGLAGKAKNGGKFFPCASANTVKQAFSAVARRLTQSQR